MLNPFVAFCWLAGWVVGKLAKAADRFEVLWDKCAEAFDNGGDKGYGDDL